MDDTRLLFFEGLFCLHSWPQNKKPSFNKNCLFIRFLPHPLQLKQCGQACQWNSPCDNPGESAVIVLPQVWQSWKRQKILFYILSTCTWYQLYENENQSLNVEQRECAQQALVAWNYLLFKFNFLHKTKQPLTFVISLYWWCCDQMQERHIYINSIKH